MPRPPKVRSPASPERTPWLDPELICRGASLHERGVLPNVANPSETIAYCAASIAKYTVEQEHRRAELALLDDRASRLRAFGFLRDAQHYEEEVRQLRRRIDAYETLVRRTAEQVERWWTEHMLPTERAKPSSEVL